jgi:hypothetical protein
MKHIPKRIALTIIAPIATVIFVLYTVWTDDNECIRKSALWPKELFK